MTISVHYSYITKNQCNKRSIRFTNYKYISKGALVTIPRGFILILTPIRNCYGTPLFDETNIPDATCLLWRKNFLWRLTFQKPSNNTVFKLKTTSSTFQTRLLFRCNTVFPGKDTLERQAATRRVLEKNIVDFLLSAVSSVIDVRN